MYIYYKQKNEQSLHHSQIQAILRKWQNVRNNVIYIANLLTSIENKKL